MNVRKKWLFLDFILSLVVNISKKEKMIRLSYLKLISFTDDEYLFDKEE